MKKTISLFLGIFLLLGCSNDESNDDNVDEPNSSGIISRIQNDAPPSYDRGDNFYYKDSKLQFLDGDNCSGIVSFP